MEYIVLSEIVNDTTGKRWFPGEIYETDNEVLAAKLIERGAINPLPKRRVKKSKPVVQNFVEVEDEDVTSLSTMSGE